MLNFQASFASETSLGNNLDFVINVNTGKPAFGLFYTYGNDPEGDTYLLTFSPQVSREEKSKSYRWNFYLASTDTFLDQWSQNHQLSMVSLQLKLKNPAYMRELLQGQKKINNHDELFLVLADQDNRPVYHIILSDLCEQYPEHFKDLSQGQRCDQLTP